MEFSKDEFRRKVNITDDHIPTSANGVLIHVWLSKVGEISILSPLRTELMCHLA